MVRIHVLTNNNHLDPSRLGGRVVIVLDVIFATTSIVTALEHGATQVLTAVDGAAARRLAAMQPDGTYVLAGELETATLPGFLDPWPQALLAHGLRGKTLIYSTTNGTVALSRVRAAAHVYAAGLINGEATIEHVMRQHRDQPILLVCSGSGENCNLEDFYGAGHLVSMLLGRRDDCAPSDAALAAAMFHDRWDAMDCLSRSRVGRILAGRKLSAEVAYSAQKGICRTVAVFGNDRLTRA